MELFLVRNYFFINTSDKKAKHSYIIAKLMHHFMSVPSQFLPSSTVTLAGASRVPQTVACVLYADQ